MADATGFGAAEWSMTRALVSRPWAPIAALQEGADDHSRPLRYFLVLNGVYVFFITVLGGFTGGFDRLPSDALEWGLNLSGKSRDAFAADFDQWYSLVAVPLISLCCVPPLALLFRRWAPSGRAAVDQAFIYLSGWTLYGAPFGLAMVAFPSTAVVLESTFLIVPAILFLRMGRGTWWRGRASAVRRLIIILLVGAAAYLPASLAIMGAAFAAASMLP